MSEASRRDPSPDVPPLESTGMLLRLAQQGDASARERLFARFLPTLRRWAHRRLPAGARGLADTDDLVQITLTRALARVPELEPRQEGSFLAYLRRILLNAVREEIRRTSRHGGPHAEPSDELHDPRVPVAEELIGRERIERYERALATLSDPAREAVLLRFEFGYSFQQVADALGKPSPDAARMMVARAVLELAHAMEDDDDPRA